MSVDDRDSFSVYVIELADGACKRSACTARLAGKPHVYVGQTKKTPDERFADHKAGGFTSASTVYKHGIRLRPRLYASWGPYPSRQESLEAEAQLAARLRARSYCVFGGH